MNNQNIDELFEQAQNDPTLFSTINIDELLENLEKDSTDYLENKTMKIINKEVFDIIQPMQCTIERKRDLCSKLVGFRVVNEIYELHKGKPVKTIRLENGVPKMALKGIVMNIEFSDIGTNILCMNQPGRFVKYRFDEHITFQKLSIDEQLILMAYEYIENH